MMEIEPTTPSGSHKGLQESQEMLFWGFPGDVVLGCPVDVGLGLSTVNGFE